MAVVNAGGANNYCLWRNVVKFLLLMLTAPGPCCLEFYAPGVGRLFCAPQNLLDLAVAAVMWWMCGHGIAFGKGNMGSNLGRFIGHGNFFARGDVRISP